MLDTSQAPKQIDRKSEAEDVISSYKDPESIFERSLSTSPFKSLPPSRRNSRVGLRPNGRSMSVVSNGSVCSLNLIPAHYSTEDFVAPVLDTTTEILTDPGIDYSEVTIVSCECDDSTCRSRHSRHKDSKASLRPGVLNRSRSKSRSFICNSLMGAFDTTDEVREEEKEDAEEFTTPVSPEGKTINFYSFADVVNGENDLEKFNAQPMSEFLT
ncbi:CIC11C00000005854 [Sungouiella intermedia]|uniref:CIC11C00000005854 n=1 Tax=Sungouiella intermedia TaxID=45354 RepID=A0A1L0GMN8_9ASCO|nr:CIC11C00000005854 [[Candida] intermedia]